MSVSLELEKLVNDGDLIKIRCYLANYLIVDPSFALFDESLEFVSAHFPIIQEHDGGVFEQDKTHWDREYLNKQIVMAFSNFSKERISHIKEVVSFIVSQSNSLRPSENHSAHRSLNVPKLGRKITKEEEVSGTRRTSGLEKQHPFPKSERKGTQRIGYKKAESTMTVQKVSAPHRTGMNVMGNSSSRTGSHVISETEIEKQSDKAPIHPASSRKFDVGIAMIAGGVVLATAGIAVVKPVVIGAGVAVAGIGIAVKASKNRK